MKSNEPIIVQALEEAILFREWCARGKPEPFKSEDWEQVREYRKLLQHARARAIRQRANDERSF